jgi:hypothetical protein
VCIWAGSRDEDDTSDQGKGIFSNDLVAEGVVDGGDTESSGSKQNVSVMDLTDVILCGIGVET